MLMIAFRNTVLNVAPGFLAVVSFTCVVLYHEKEIKISHVVKGNHSQYKLKIKIIYRTNNTIS